MKTSVGAPVYDAPKRPASVLLPFFLIPFLFPAGVLVWQLTGGSLRFMDTTFFFWVLSSVPIIFACIAAAKLKRPGLQPLNDRVCYLITLYGSLAVFAAPVIAAILYGSGIGD